MFNTDSWIFKVAVVVAILCVRESVRILMHPRAAGVLPVGSRRREPRNGAVEALDTFLLVIGLLMFVIQPGVVQAYRIPSGSMEDTLQYKPSEDRVLVSKAVYRVREPQAGDIVVFEPPPQTDAAPGENLIKRCIGAPGDTIEVRNRKLYRNGKLLNEPYVKWSTQSYSYDMKIVHGKVYTRERPFHIDFGFHPPWVQEHHARDPQVLPAPNQEYIDRHKPEAVPSGMYLMLGDHRDNSNDGHVWGFVPRENIIGKAFCVFWPPSRFGLLDKISEQPRRTTSTSLRSYNRYATLGY
jgi:signal peptidase I